MNEALEEKIAKFEEETAFQDLWFNTNKSLFTFLENFYEENVTLQTECKRQQHYNDTKDDISSILNQFVKYTETIEMNKRTLESLEKEKRIIARQRCYTKSRKI